MHTKDTVQFLIPGTPEQLYGMAIFYLFVFNDISALLHTKLPFPLHLTTTEVFQTIHLTTSIYICIKYIHVHPHIYTVSAIMNPVRVRDAAA
mmetsp:Transcript_11432/g.15739  ORF Transcript_11432/g.15739 Transcript_11432/m.15739 type:complete len:92 (-) Transcript_11432:1397-1672(-)